MKKPLGRPNLGKTETIRQRAVNVYLPTEEMLGKWKAEAERYGVPLSRFIVETVDDSIRKNPAGVTPRETLEKELNDAKAELKTVRERLDSAEAALKRADVTIAEYRSKLTNPVLPSAETELTARLIEILIAEKALNTDEVPDRLNLDMTDKVSVDRLKASVDLLRKVGLVESGMFEWRWIGGRETEPERKPKRKPHITRKRRRELGRIRREVPR
jgi:hypothetical protein